MIYKRKFSLNKERFKEGLLFYFPQNYTCLLEGKHEYCINWVLSDNNDNKTYLLYIGSRFS